MSIKSGVRFNKATGEIIGYPDLRSYDNIMKDPFRDVAFNNKVSCLLALARSSVINNLLL